MADAAKMLSNVRFAVQGLNSTIPSTICQYDNFTWFALFSKQYNTAPPTSSCYSPPPTHHQLLLQLPPTSSCYSSSPPALATAPPPCLARSQPSLSSMLQPQMRMLQPQVSMLQPQMHMLQPRGCMLQPCGESMGSTHTHTHTLAVVSRSPPQCCRPPLTPTHLNTVMNRTSWSWSS